jgi:hypothetical protein
LFTKYLVRVTALTLSSAVRTLITSKPSAYCKVGRLRLKCDGTRAETRFHLSTKRTSPFKSARGVSSVHYWQASCTHQPAGFELLLQACVLQSCDAYWQASCTHQPAGFVLLLQDCVLQSCDAYWLPTPFSCFTFTSPPVRHRVPSHFNWTLPVY